jgi:GMP synthase-like glutamine amidotransferase
MIRIHVLQHVPFEPPGIIETWIRKKNHKLTKTKFFADDSIPEISSFDWLVVMGGPMSTYEEEKYYWLKKEKEFIKSAIKNNKVVIGICLGSQLIAAALGAKVYPNKYKEIGWFPVRTTDHSAKHNLFSSLPKELNVFHWHGDTFDLPDGTVLLAESEGCKNQLFIWEERVIGLQFHVEITEELIKGLIENGRAELKKDTYVQLEDEILKRTDLVPQCNFIMEDLLYNLENKSARE